MLLTSAPYVNIRSNGPPRIISEIRKPETYVEPMRPRITSDLLVVFGNERRWCPRRLSIRGGQLFVGSAHGDAATSIRVPLRHMSLRAGPLPNSLSLIKGQTLILTLQTANERVFELWVKTIAIELIRQTPLEAVKYLDILTFADSWNKKKPGEDPARIEQASSKTTSSTPIASTPLASTSTTALTYTKIDHNRRTDVNRNYVSKQPEMAPKAEPEACVELLLKKCQNAENYVPVREKLVLFESLCKIGRVRSSEDVSMRNSASSTNSKRARSLHDLSNCIVSNGVREICKYFEKKTDQTAPSRQPSTAQKRLIYSDTSLHRTFHDNNVIHKTNNSSYVRS